MPKPRIRARFTPNLAADNAGVRRSRAVWAARLSLLFCGLVLTASLGTAPTAIAQEAGSGSAETETAVPLTTEAAAQAALAAHTGGDAARLEELAATYDPDPWMVADELLRLGEPDAALVLARSAPKHTAEPLAAYVEAARTETRPGPLDRTLEELQAKAESGDVAGALALLPDDADGLFAVRVPRARGLLLTALNRHGDASAAHASAADAAEKLGWVRAAAEQRFAAARELWRTGDREGALRTAAKAVALAEPLGNVPVLAEALNLNGGGHLSARRVEQAIPLLERAIAVQDALGLDAASSLTNLGEAYRALRRHRDVIRVQLRVLPLMEAAGNDRRVEIACQRLAFAHRRLGERAEALHYYQRAREFAVTAGNRVQATMLLADIAELHAALGQVEEALELGAQALESSRAMRNPVGISGALRAMSLARRMQGRLAEALDLAEQALVAAEATRRPSFVVQTLNLAASLYEAVGRPEKAVELLRRAQQLVDPRQNPSGYVMCLANTGLLLESMGELDEALSTLGAALERLATLDAPTHEITLHVGRANVLRSLERHAEAIEAYERALVLLESPGVSQPLDRAACLLGRGATRSNLGQEEEALADYATALDIAREHGSVPFEIRALANAAITYANLGRMEEVVDTLRAYVDLVPLLAGGLSDVQGARARERWSGMVGLGVSAAVLLGDLEQTNHLIETSRAGVLLESLGGRDNLAEAVLPDDLRTRRREAAAKVQAAERALAAAMDSRKLKAAREARAALQTARGELVDVLERAQRSAKSQVGVVHPKPATVEQMQATLQPGEALLTYVVLRAESSPAPGLAALLITPDDARTTAHLVGLTRDFEPGEEALESALRLPTDLPTDDPTGWKAAAADLREQLITPLGLPNDLKRLYIAPDGPLTFVPFALLLPGIDVVHVPSGTTLELLRSEKRPVGEGVLALGDPDYEAPRGRLPESVSAEATRGARLTRLPGTRIEAEAVGDIVLLGDEATEAHLRAALETRERWRAIHLACHGLVHPTNSLLSSLAVTPDSADDGYLMTAEVFRLRAPADLVVLSACETGRGELFESDGVVGFTHAFLLAGASRVIVSLWKVDDQATRALMTEFYRLWNPPAGSEMQALPAATALRRAQEHIRAQEKWSDPVYWAAWQLWGLGD